MKIEEVKSTSQKLRISAHSHVKGLGLSATGEALKNITDGLVGQEAAREACGIFVELIKTRTKSGRGLLLAGPPCTGKTAMAIGISQELGLKVPFCAMVGSDVFSAEVKKTEVLTENFRRAIGLRIKEVKEVYEGEVTELKPIEALSSDSTTYAKSISHVLIGLKTTKNAKKLKLDASIYDELVKEQVQVGDIIYIEANSGNVKRVGKSDFFASEFDLEKETYVPVPKGDVHKKKEVLQNVTLHDLDAANAKPTGGKDLASLVAGLNGKKTEITDKLRAEINKIVNKYVEQGLCEVIPGVLFIDEVHMLDLECFTFLNKSLESDLSPILVLATNRGISRVRGSDLRSAHGIPVDLLDRLLIVKTLAYSAEEAMQILALRASIEKVKILPDALTELAKIASNASLRYAVQLLRPSTIIAEKEGEDTVAVSHVSEADQLFADVKRSAKRLIEQEDEFLK